MIFHTDSFTDACVEAQRIAKLYKCRVRVYLGSVDFYVLEDIYSSLLRGWLFLAHPSGDVTQISGRGEQVKAATEREKKIIKLQDYRR